MIKSPSSCGGVEKTSTDSSETRNAVSDSRAKVCTISQGWNLFGTKADTFVFIRSLHGRQRHVKDFIVAHTLERYIRILSAVGP